MRLKELQKRQGGTGRGGKQSKRSLAQAISFIEANLKNGRYHIDGKSVDTNKYTLVFVLGEKTGLPNYIAYCDKQGSLESLVFTRYRSRVISALQSDKDGNIETLKKTKDYVIWKTSGFMTPAEEKSQNWVK